MAKTPKNISFFGQWRFSSWVIFNAPALVNRKVEIVIPQC